MEITSGLDWGKVVTFKGSVGVIISMDLSFFEEKRSKKHNQINPT